MLCSNSYKKVQDFIVKQEFTDTIDTNYVEISSSSQYFETTIGFSPNDPQSNRITLSH
jgi:hypothetical protein